MDMLAYQSTENLEAYKLTYKYTRTFCHTVDVTFYIFFTENNEWRNYNYSPRLWYRAGLEPQNSIALAFRSIQAWKTPKGIIKAT